MNKRKILVIIGIFLILIVISFVLSRKPVEVEEEASERQLATGQVPFELPQTKIELKDIPRQASEVVIPDSSVSVENFYKSAVRISGEGDAVIVSQEDFEISYLAQFSQFIISITGPFEETRQVAESAFLTRLGIDEVEACKLNVTVSTPSFANPDKSGVNYPLSFCQGGL